MRKCGKRNISLLYFGHTQCVWESLDARAEQSFLLLLLFLFPFPFPSAFPFDSLTGSWFHIGNCIFIYNWHFYFNRFLHTSLSCMLTFVTPSPRPPALPALAQDTLWNATDKWSRILAWNSKLPRRHRRRRRSNQVTNKPQKPIKPRKPQLVCSLPPCPLFAQPFLPLLLFLLWLERGLCTWLKCLLLLGMVAVVGGVALPATTCSLHVCVCGCVWVCECVCVATTWQRFIWQIARDARTITWLDAPRANPELVSQFPAFSSLPPIVISLILTPPLSLSHSRCR